MGTDIHTYIEHKKGKWQKVPDSLGPESYFSVAGLKSRPNEWDLPRNYELFGLLAAVRRETEPFKEPVGLPIDLSKDVKIEYDSWHGDCHTPSYYTLTELLSFTDYTLQTTEFVETDNYIKYKNGDYNFSFSWSMYHPGNIISNSEMDRLIKLIPFMDKIYATEITYAKPVQLVCQYFWDRFIPAMQKLDDNTDNVRMVFWFDN